MANKKVRITCSGNSFLPFKQLQDFQGELKSRTQDDIDHIIESIDRHGFAFPFFVWRQPTGVCSCLDGHGRLLALTKMEQEGYEIPELPVVYIDAKDEKEARARLIYVNTTSGHFSDNGFRELVKDIPDFDFNAYNFPELNLKKLEKEMKILEEAQNHIQVNVQDVDWTASFGEDPYNEETFSSGSIVPPPEDSHIPGSPSTFAVSAQPSDSASISAMGATEFANGISISSAITNSDAREMTITCPDCGETFIFNY